MPGHQLRHPQPGARVREQFSAQFRVVGANPDGPYGRQQPAHLLGNQAGEYPLPQPVAAHAFAAVVQQGGGDQFGAGAGVVAPQLPGHPAGVFAVTRVHRAVNQGFAGGEPGQGPGVVGLGTRRAGAAQEAAQAAYELRRYALGKPLGKLVWCGKRHRGQFNAPSRATGGKLQGDMRILGLALLAAIAVLYFSTGLRVGYVTLTQTYLLNASGTNNYTLRTLEDGQQTGVTGQCSVRNGRAVIRLYDPSGTQIAGQTCLKGTWSLDVVGGSTIGPYRLVVNLDGYTGSLNLKQVHRSGR